MKASFFGDSENVELRDRLFDDEDTRIRKFRLKNRSVLSLAGMADEVDGKFAYSRPIFSPMIKKSKETYPISQSRGVGKYPKERKTGMLIKVFDGARRGEKLNFIPG